MTNPNEAAFAGSGGKTENYACTPSYGLTKREYFAAMALQGLLAGMGDPKEMTQSDVSIIPNSAVIIADRLIEELNTTHHE